jgi:hypothetical protein
MFNLENKLAKFFSLSIYLLITVNGMSQNIDINQKVWVSNFDKYERKEQIIVDSINICQDGKKINLFEFNKKLEFKLFVNFKNRYHCRIYSEKNEIYNTATFESGNLSFNFLPNKYLEFKDETIHILIQDHFGQKLNTKIVLRFKQDKPKIHIVKPIVINTLQINDNLNSDNLRNSAYRINNEISPGELVEITGVTGPMNDSITNFLILPSSRLVEVSNVKLENSNHKLRQSKFTFNLKTSMIGLNVINIKLLFSRNNHNDTVLISIPFDKQLNWQIPILELDDESIEENPKISEIQESDMNTYFNNKRYISRENSQKNNKVEITALQNEIAFVYNDRISINHKYYRIKILNYYLFVGNTKILGQLIKSPKDTNQIQVYFVLTANGKHENNSEFITLGKIERVLEIVPVLNKINSIGLGYNFEVNGLFYNYNSFNNLIWSFSYMNIRRFGWFANVMSNISTFTKTTDQIDNQVFFENNQIRNSNSAVYYKSTGKFINQSLGMNVGFCNRINKNLFWGIGYGLFKREIFKEYSMFDYSNNALKKEIMINCSNQKIAIQPLYNIKVGYLGKKYEFGIETSLNKSIKFLTMKFGYEF